MGIWKTAEGEEIPFRDLTDSHLVNIIHYLEKKAPENHDKITKKLRQEIEDHYRCWKLFGDSTERRNYLFKRKRLEHVEGQDRRNPQPYAGASPYRELVKLAIFRGLLGEGYTWRTPIEEQERDMLKMAALPHVYGMVTTSKFANDLASAPPITFESLMEVAEAMRNPHEHRMTATEMLLREHAVRQAERMINPPIVIQSCAGMEPGNAIMFAGTSPFEGPAYITGIKHDHIYISHSRLEKLAPRSHTRKLRK